jgi:hypothetical protein
LLQNSAGQVAEGRVCYWGSVDFFTAKRPNEVASFFGLKNHASDEWPAHKGLAMGVPEEVLEIPSYMRDYPGRLDSDVYRQLPDTSGKSFHHWELKNDKHPYRGWRARARWADTLKRRSAPLKAKRASGMTWDQYVERRHRMKDFSGGAVVMRRFAARSLSDAISPPEPLGRMMRSLKRANIPKKVAPRRLPLRAGIVFCKDAQTLTWQKTQ